jgi:hypothetical protein
MSSIKSMAELCMVIAEEYSDLSLDQLRDFDRRIIEGIARAVARVYGAPEAPEVVELREVRAEIMRFGLWGA